MLHLVKSVSASNNTLRISPHLFLGLPIILKTFLAFLHESFVKVLFITPYVAHIWQSAVPAVASAADFQISQASGEAHSADITTYLQHFMSVRTNRVCTVLHLILIFHECQPCILK